MTKAQARLAFQRFFGAVAQRVWTDFARRRQPKAVPT
jgi:hypothetical protein